MLGGLLERGVKTPFTPALAAVCITGSNASGKTTLLRRMRARLGESPAPLGCGAPPRAGGVYGNLALIHSDWIAPGGGPEAAVPRWQALGVRAPFLAIEGSHYNVRTLFLSMPWDPPCPVHVLHLVQSEADYLGHLALRRAQSAGRRWGKAKTPLSPEATARRANYETTRRYPGLFEKFSAHIASIVECPVEPDFSGLGHAQDVAWRLLEKCGWRGAH